MDLIAAGIVLLLLFVATYSERKTWITLGSAALSIALVAGCVFFSTARGSSQIHDGLAQIAKRLPAGWDRPALKLTAAIEQASASLAHAREEAATHPPILKASISDWFSWGSWSKTETKTENKTEPEAKPEAEPEPETASEASTDLPIKWLLDAPAPTETFALSGTNVSDQPLADVQAVLKPDSGEGEVTLGLEGGSNGAVIPPGARFSLAAETLTRDEAKKLGGAILSVSYVQDGSRKSSIMYLSPPTIAALTEGD